MCVLCYEDDDPQTVKTRLRQWAQVVACAVRQSWMIMHDDCCDGNDDGAWMGDYWWLTGEKSNHGY